jgi:hypothetical protein
MLTANIPLEDNAGGVSWSGKAVKTAKDITEEINDDKK